MTRSEGVRHINAPSMSEYGDKGEVDEIVRRCVSLGALLCEKIMDGPARLIVCF